MKKGRTSTEISFTKSIINFLEDQHHVYHLLFEIIILIVLVSVMDTIIIPNQDTFSMIWLLLAVSIAVDYSIWKNKYQSALFALLVLGYFYYSSHQKKHFKQFYQYSNLKNELIRRKKNEYIGNGDDERDNWSTMTNYSQSSLHSDYDKINRFNNNNNNNFKNIDTDDDPINYQSAIPNPNVFDFTPDNINKEEIVNPYMKGIRALNIEKGLNGLPMVDYSDTPTGKMNRDMLNALDDRHTIPLMENELVISEENDFRQGDYRNAIGISANDRPKNVKLIHKKWNLDRYYPKCKTINDEPTKDLKISNKTIQYCTNLPDIREDQYNMVSGDQVELVDSSIPHIQIFPKQFDIGGQGIVSRDFNADK